MFSSLYGKCLSDSIFFYSYIDTSMLYREILKKKYDNETTNFYYNLYTLNYYLPRNMVKEAKIKLNKVKEFNKNAFYKKERLNIILFRMWYYLKIKDTIKANKIFNKIYKSKNIPDNIKIKAINIISYTYAFENTVYASSLLNEAIEKGLSDSIPELYHTFLNLSALYLSFNLVNEAEKCIINGIKFKRKYLNPILDNLYVHNLAIIKMAKNQYDTAIYLFKKTYEFSKSYHLPEYMAGSLINIARQYYYKNNLDSAKYYLFKDLPFIKQNEDILSENFKIKYYWMISDYYNLKKDYDSTLFYLKNTLTFAKKGKNYEALAEIYFNIAELYNKIFNAKDSSLVYYNSAYSTLKYFYEIKSLKFTTLNAQKFQLLENFIKLKDIEIALLQKESKIKNIKRFYLLLAISILLFSVLVLFIIRNNYINNAKKLKEKFARDLIKSHEKYVINLSSEIHDNIAHNLLLLSKNEKLNSDKDLQESLAKIIDDVRNLSHEIFPGYLFKMSLSELIINMINKLEMSTNFTVISEIENIDTDNKDIKLNVYRICQELISNSLKYCSEKIVYITLKKEKKYYVLRYRDVNKIKNKKIKEGFGLINIAERTKIINGKFKYYYKSGFNAIIKFNKA